MHDIRPAYHRYKDTRIGNLLGMRVFPRSYRRKGFYIVSVL